MAASALPIVDPIASTSAAPFVDVDMFSVFDATIPAASQDDADHLFALSPPRGATQSRGYSASIDRSSN
jgi:hypothetical protein